MIPLALLCAALIGLIVYPVNELKKVVNALQTAGILG